MTTLFVSPHFDDVVLSCVAHVAEARRQGRVIVATAFGAGQPGRRAEDARALALLNVEQVVLPFADAPQRLTIAPGFRSLLLERYPRETDDRADLIASLRPLIQTACVTRIVLPLAVGGHVDHRVVHGLHDAWPPELDVHFYEDEPYARIAGALAARMTEIGGDIGPASLAVVTAAQSRASALKVFGPLLRAGGDAADSSSAVEVFANRLAHAGPEGVSANPVGRLTSQQVPAVPELAEAALRCYGSQLPDWFPTAQQLRAFVHRNVVERTWRKQGRS